MSTLSAREKIAGGAVRITGRFTQEEADDFALKLKSGAMRASMKFLEENLILQPDIARLLLSQL